MTNPQYCWQLASLMINDFAVARAVHVLALVHWIGGVAMVTTIVLPRARASADAHAALAAFEAFEVPFAAQARFSILLAGLSGLYMLNKLQTWALLLDPAFWWLALMVAVWAVFAVIVFVLEPLVLDRVFHDYALLDKHRAFSLAIRLHALALTISCVAIVAGVLGTQGALP
ncbi:MAG: hypothetical protein WAV38_26855 [Xanthobacteraceae bacterium]